MLTPALPLTLALSILVAPAGAQTLVFNANQVPSNDVPSSAPDGFTAFGAETVFSAETASTGREAWLTDGTAAGTRLLLDLFPGATSGLPREWTPLGGGDWVFAVNTPPFGSELWRTDGTAQGTALVADLQLGPSGSEPSGLAEHNGEVYFYAAGDDAGRSLWKSDGTLLGTVEVSDFSTAGVASPTSGFEAALSTSLGLFFTSTTGSTWSLWRTDGVPGNEVLLAEVSGAPFDAPAELVELGGRLFFTAAAPSTGAELWSSDGTPGGTGVVVDLLPGFDSASPRWLTPYAGELYFAARANATQRELFKTDGTPGGTLQITLSSPTVTPQGTAPEWLTPANGFLAFAGNDPTHGRELFATLGTPGQWFLAADFAPGSASSSPSGLTAFGGEVFCRAFVDSVGVELFATDGTPAGTRLVADIDPAPFASGDPRELTVQGDVLVFAASESTAGSELWVSDGTTAGTQRLVDIAESALDLGSDPAYASSLGSRAIYFLDDGVVGREPWITSGAGPAVELVTDVHPGPLDATSLESFSWRGEVWFSGFEPGTGEELWATDGTAAGTRLVGDLDPNDIGGIPRFLGVLGDQLFFSADALALGRELWVTDGTPEGTRLVRDINPGPGFSTPESWVVRDGLAYFNAFSAQSGGELWATDGTTAGTQLVADIYPGLFSSSFFPGLALFDDRIWIGATDGTDGGIELYASDGTAEGTQLVHDFVPGGGGAPGNFTVVGDYLLMTANTPDGSRQLFSLAEGASVPVQLTAFAGLPFGFGGGPPLRTAGGFAYLLIDEPGISNQLLLRTDGTVAGTALIAAIDPTQTYQPGKVVTNGATTDGRLLFVANDGTFGSELWMTDGTTEGTTRLTDINPAGGDANPGNLLRAGNRFYFAANDGQTGVELHSIPVATTGGWIAEPFGEGCPGVGGVPQLLFDGEARLGADFTLQLRAAAPSSLAFLFFDLAGAATDLGGGCRSYLPTPTVLATLPTSSRGEADLPLTLPLDPVLIGLDVWTQMAVSDPLGAYNGVASLTSALELVVGQ